MAVTLCDADKDLIYPIVAPFSKLLERLPNKLKIFMVHFTSVGFCNRKEYNNPVIPLHTTGSLSFYVNTLLIYKYCKDINTVNCCLQASLTSNPKPNPKPLPKPLTKLHNR